VLRIGVVDVDRGWSRHCGDRSRSRHRGTPLLLLRRLPSSMGATHRCICGATLRYKQDLDRERGTVSSTWKCTDCGTPVPGVIAERISHQHPS